MKIISWQSVLTDHQAYTIRALQVVAGDPILVVSGVKELKERKLQGWPDPSVEGLHVQYLPIQGWWKEGLKILHENQDTVHIFNSMWGDRRFFPLLLAAQYMGIQTMLMTEPYSDVAVGYLSEGNPWLMKVKTILRPWLYRLAGILVAKRFKTVFAISSKAIEQFTHIGVSQENIVPFGYFVPKISLERVVSRDGRKTLKLVFVGSLIQRKGIGVLVAIAQACAEKNLDIILDVYGHGDSTLLKGITNTSYKGVIPFGQAQEVISAYDVLLLPSLYDGWGVVVNEALLQGIPAIVSDNVGAKALVEKSGAGLILSVNEVSSWVDCIENISNNPNLLKKWKESAMQYQKYLEPQVAAKYLFDSLSLSTKNKKNPWYY